MDRKERLMALELLIDERHRHGERPMVSINPKLKRIVMYRSTRELMVQNYGEQFEAVVILIDRSIKDAFWIRPCRLDVEGARRLHKTSDTTRSLSCSLLLQQLQWKGEKTQRFPVEWDAENSAAKVLFKRVETEKI